MRVHVALTALLWGLAAGLADAACTPEIEPDNAPAEATPLPDGAFCGKGVAVAGDQDMMRFDPATAGLWTLSLEAPPGAQGKLELIDLPGDGSAAVPGWSGDLDPDNGLVESPPLLLAAGDYVVAIASADPKLTWRVHGTPAALPPPLTGAQTNAFAGTLSGTGDPINLGWTVAEAAGAGLWTLTLQGEVAGKPRLDLIGPDGTTLGASEAADSAGRVVLSDLGLAPGTYQMRVSGVPKGGLALVAATLPASDGTAGPALVAEPDDTIDLAHDIAPGQVLSGRLDATGGGADTDFFRFSASGRDGPQKIVRLTGPADAELSVTLTDAKGIDITDPFAGKEGVVIGPLALPEGSYGIKVQGTTGPQATYTLALDDAPPLAAGTEAEPNDRADYASELAVGGTVKGTDRPGGTDFVAVIAPPKDLGWWKVAVTSPGSLEVQMRDGQGNILADGRASDGQGVTFGRLPLVPGRNLFKIDGPGPWSMSVTPTTPPGVDEEREPNDDAGRATLLTHPGIWHFALDHAGDRDVFALPLGTPHAVDLSLSLPADSQPDVEITVPVATGAVALDLVPDPARPTQVTGHWHGLVPSGTLTLQVDAAEPATGAAEMQVTLGPPFDTSPSTAQGTAEPAVATVAAEEGRMQRLQIKARFDAGLPNGQIAVRSWVSETGWRIGGLPNLVDLGGAALDLPMTLEAPPYLDAGAVTQWAVALSDPQSGAILAVAQGQIEAKAGADPQSPTTFSPLPATLLGAIDAARSDFGASLSDPTAAALVDGDLDGTDVALPLGAPLDIHLAGNAPVPVPVLGFVLTPPAAGADAGRLRRVRIEARSLDGSFAPLWEGEVDLAAHPQPVVLPSPVTTDLIRVTPLTTWGDAAATTATLSELSVLVPPAALPGDFDLGRPEFGGHLLYATKTIAPVVGDSTEWPGAGVAFHGEAGQAPEWVMGFYDGRAAAISAITLTNDASASPDARITGAEVYASLDGPLGPWQSLGTLSMEAPDHAQGTLRLSPPVWARNLRFVGQGPDATAANLPASIAVTEDRAASAGGTILGEWGPGRSAVFEARPDAGPTALGLTGGVTRASPVPLPPQVAGSGQVSGADRSRWFSLAAPPDARQIKITLHSDGVETHLFDASGAELALTGTGDALDADVTGHTGPFLLDLERPRDSVVVAWDTSGSVATFAPAIFTAVENMAADLKTGDIAMNFVPFRAANREGLGQPLLPDFAEDAGTAWAALNGYDDADGDSDSEAALIVAAHALQARPGRHAVVLITDGSFFNTLSNEAWAAIDAARLRIYALQVPSGSRDRASRIQALEMHDWAAFNGGQHRIFADPADARGAFRDLTADLQRPIAFRLTWTAETAPPPPAVFRVLSHQTASAASPGVAAAGGQSIEVILDASGSMLQKIGGARKIDMAKSILLKLATSTLPKGSDFALRVFGIGGKGSCVGKAVLPLAPLDPAQAQRIISAVTAQDGAKTAIGASLRDAAADLANAPGGRLLVLITDGEEDCGGDPAAEIKALNEKGFAVRLNIVGFNLDTPALKDLFQRWAKAGGGSFFDAKDGKDLDAAVLEAVSIGYTVSDAAGTVVAQGKVDGDPVTLPAGTYALHVEGAPHATTVTLGPGETHDLVWP